MKTKFNRVIYLFFVVVGVVSLVMQEYLTTVSLLGIAILFDPFDADQSWREKPFWQKAVFSVQGLMVVGIFIPLMFNLWENW